MLTTCARGVLLFLLGWMSLAKATEVVQIAQAQAPIPQGTFVIEQPPEANQIDSVWEQKVADIQPVCDKFISVCSETERAAVTKKFTDYVDTYRADHNVSLEDAWQEVFTTWVYDNWKKLGKDVVPKRTLLEMCIGFVSFSQAVKNPPKLVLDVLTKDTIKLLCGKLKPAGLETTGTLAGR